MWKDRRNSVDPPSVVFLETEYRTKWHLANLTPATWSGFDQWYNWYKIGEMFFDRKRRFYGWTRRWWSNFRSSCSWNCIFDNLFNTHSTKKLNRIIFSVLYFDRYRGIPDTRSKTSTQFASRQNCVNNSGIADISVKIINWVYKKEYVVQGITDITKEQIKFFSFTDKANVPLNNILSASY